MSASRVFCQVVNYLLTFVSVLLEGKNNICSPKMALSDGGEIVSHTQKSAKNSKIFILPSHPRVCFHFELEEE